MCLNYFLQTYKMSFKTMVVISVKSCVRSDIFFYSGQKPVFRVLTRPVMNEIMLKFASFYTLRYEKHYLTLEAKITC